MLSALKSRIYISLVIFVLIFTVTLITVYAYFQAQEQRGIIIQTGDFEVEMIVSFNSVIVTANSPYYDRELGTIIVNVFDDTSDNYVGDLEISIAVTAVVPARVRFKLQEEWTRTRTYLDQNPEYPIADVVEVVYHTNHGSTYYPFSLLKLHPLFSPIYDLHGYTYITDVVPKEATTIIPFIQSGDEYVVKNNEVFYEVCYLHINLIVDVVQANRFVELWGIDQDFFN